MPLSKTDLHRCSDHELVEMFGDRAMRMHWPMKIGRLKRPGYKAPMNVYLFWCRHCRLTPNRGFTVTHANGYQGRLHCGYCRRRYDQFLPSRRLADVLRNPHRHPRFLLLILILVVLATRIAS